MRPVNSTRTTAFSDTSIEEVDSITSLGFGQLDEQATLIASFKQPFPIQERARSVVDGEMDAYG